MGVGLLSHVEINVSDLERSRAFWGWLLPELGWEPYQSWPTGVSWRLASQYLVFCQVEPRFRLHGPFHRRRVGLNHLAFAVGCEAIVDRVVEQLPLWGTQLLYPERHPHAGGAGYYGAFFEDPDRIKVEVVVQRYDGATERRPGAIPGAVTRCPDAR